MYNKVVLVGNLTRDIEMRYAQGGMAIAKTAIATSRKFKSNTGEQKEEVCFVDITFFGRSAEVANQYLRKGSKALVEGRLQFEQWTDQNGQKRSKHGVNVDTMQMLDSKNQSLSQPSSYPQQQVSDSSIPVVNVPKADYQPQSKPQQTWDKPSAVDENVMAEIDAMEKIPF